MATIERMLDAVVANAGFQHVSPLRDFPEEQWDKLQALLVTSPFLLAKYSWDALGPAAIALGKAEGLDAHARSVGMRLNLT